MFRKNLLFSLFCLVSLMTSAKITTYRNIPYATADRFRMPELTAGFDPKADHTARGPICWQLFSHKDDSIWGFQNENEMSEHCQVLTVNTPYKWLAPGSTRKDTLLPVVVHIHGGCFLTGGGEQELHDMDELAERTNMVTVSISYRLGALGFLYEPDSAGVNLGLYDQLNALRWIRAHISEFGGDPKNVTLIGQSAGAQSVVYLLSMMDEPLVRRAIIFSAPMGYSMPEELAMKRSGEFIDQLHGQPFYQCSADSILAAQVRVCQAHSLDAMPFSPSGIQQQPFALHHRPDQVVVCWQKNDAAVFVPKASLCKGVTAMMFKTPSKRYVSYLKSQNVNVKQEELTWHPHGSKYGPTHCCELVLLTGHNHNWVGTQLAGDVSAEELTLLRDAFALRISAFARTGKW